MRSLFPASFASLLHILLGDAQRRSSFLLTTEQRPFSSFHMVFWLAKRWRKLHTKQLRVFSP